MSNIHINQSVTRERGGFLMSRGKDKRNGHREGYSLMYWQGLRDKSAPFGINPSNGDADY